MSLITTTFRPSVEVAPGVGFRLTETRIGAGAGASFPPLNISDRTQQSRRPELEMGRAWLFFGAGDLYDLCVLLWFVGGDLFLLGVVSKRSDGLWDASPWWNVYILYICPTKSQRGCHFMVKLGRCFKRDFLRTAALVVFASANVATDDDLLVRNNAHLRAQKVHQRNAKL